MRSDHVKWRRASTSRSPSTWSAAKATSRRTPAKSFWAAVGGGSSLSVDGPDSLEQPRATSPPESRSSWSVAVEIGGYRLCRRFGSATDQQHSYNPAGADRADHASHKALHLSRVVPSIASLAPGSWVRCRQVDGSAPSSVERRSPRCCLLSGLPGVSAIRSHVVRVRRFVILGLHQRRLRSAPRPASRRPQWRGRDRRPATW